MRKRLLCGLILIFGTGANAQWLNYPTPGTPRTKDGKPNLAAPAPRTRDGKPDLSGVWQADGAPHEELVKYLGPTGMNLLGESDPARYFVNILGDYKPGEITLTPAAEALFNERGAAFGADSP